MLQIIRLHRGTSDEFDNWRKGLPRRIRLALLHNRGMKRKLDHQAAAAALLDPALVRPADPPDVPYAPGGRST
jgi:hypothetical protein